MNTAWHMRTVKYPAAAEVVDLLGDLPVLHVGSLALDSWRRPGFLHYFNSLDLLVREADLNRFRRAMESHHPPYQLILDDPDTRTARAVPDLEPSPATPGPAYSSRVQYPSELWIRFYTTWRHGHLLLVDLEPWFAGYDELPWVPVMEAHLRAGYARRIKRPPAWAMLLWQAGLVTAAAAEQSVTKEDLETLHLIAKQVEADNSWEQALTTARRYDRQYRDRIGDPRTAQMIAAYAGGNEDILQAEMAYGACYELRHALEALRSYPEYREAVPQGAVERLAATGTGSEPRKIWNYPDVHRGDRVALDDAVGCLGAAVPAFTIGAQIDRYIAGADCTWQGLIDANLVTIVGRAPGGPPPQAPTHGPWHGCTEQKLRQIYG